MEQGSVVALIASTGIRLVRLADPVPSEVSIPETRTRTTRDGVRPIARTRRFVRQDAYTYIEIEQIGSVR